ncbi:MAG TPA: hypothetical protein VIQ54_05260 [Polyangia bacterium]|jgi:hypothetical protein
MRAPHLIVLALAIPACGGSYVYQHTLGPPGPFPMPARCRIWVFEGPPERVHTSENGRPPEQMFMTPFGLNGYREVGVIEFRGRRGPEWPTRDFKRFRDHVAPTICQHSGGAIAARVDAEGYYVGGTVLEGPSGAGDSDHGHGWGDSDDFPGKLHDRAQ